MFRLAPFIVGLVCAFYGWALGIRGSDLVTAVSLSAGNRFVANAILGLDVAPIVVILVMMLLFFPQISLFLMR